MSVRQMIPFVAVLSLVLTTGSPAAAEPPPRLSGVQMVEAWPDAEFTNPLGVYHADDGSDRLYVLEKPGRVQMLPKWRGVGPVPKAKVFLDMRSLVHAGAQGGVLGLAFHPRYAETKRVYVSYLQTHSDPRAAHLKFKLVIGELRVRGGTADVSSLRPILEIPKKFAIHQCGRIGFGPDQMLYIATGDGGSKNDADGEAQNARGLLGKILRIDVNQSGAGRAYGIPSDNPWPNLPGRVHPEIWAFGLRNPWGFDWDASGRMWATEPGTTGPESREWVTEIVRAGNHGWPFMEGTRRLSSPPPHIDPNSLVPVSFEYVRGTASGTAGVGGRFYTGRRIPALRGRYVFGDFMKGEVYSIELTGPKGRTVGRGWQLLGEVPDLAGVGNDAQGELYFPSYELGMIFTLAPE